MMTTKLFNYKHVWLCSTHLLR